MHIQGVSEYFDPEASDWIGIQELPFIVRSALYYELFGKCGPLEERTPVAPDRGFPEDASTLAIEQHERERRDPAHIDSDWPAYDSFGESWLTMNEFPDRDRERFNDHKCWGPLFDELAVYEADYGPEHVRLVVWFTW